VPVGDEAVLARARPDTDALTAVLAAGGATCAYVNWPDPGGAGAQARSFFLDASGVAEDPATGSAAGPLCAYLNARTGAGAFEIVQGVTMGRPSRLLCQAGERVRVSGDVVLLIEGQIAL
jgi:trans-2,3-dihydro-3-hydroxyanthranilate isomerase